VNLSFLTLCIKSSYSNLYSNT